jgi:lipid II:glycine glycyltransferase (peptidoglycan interpeptide bridge formation enzyme)
MYYIGSQLPVPKFSSFLRLMRTFSSNEMVVFLLRKNQTVAGGLLIYLFDVKKAMILEYSALNRKLPNVYTPTYALFWHAVKKASEMGYNTIDFGGTPNNPNDIHYRIKEKFHCNYEQRYQISFPRSNVIIDTALSRLTRQ